MLPACVSLVFQFGAFLAWIGLFVALYQEPSDPANNDIRVLVCLLLFWFGLFLMGLVTGLYRSITTSFEAADELTALHALLQFSFFAAVERV